MHYVIAWKLACESAKHYKLFNRPVVLMENGPTRKPMETGKYSKKLEI
jgi:hypothetical protein